MHSPMNIIAFALALSGIHVANAMPADTPAGYGTTTTTPKTPAGYGTTKTTSTTSKATCSVSTIWTNSVGQTTKPIVKTTVVTLPGQTGSTCSKKQVTTNIPKTITFTKNKDTVVTTTIVKNGVIPSVVETYTLVPSTTVIEKPTVITTTIKETKSTTIKKPTKYTTQVTGKTTITSVYTDSKPKTYTDVTTIPTVTQVKQCTTTTGKGGVSTSSTTKYETKPFTTKISTTTEVCGPKGYGKE